MTTEINMPRLSETMVDGRIVSWNKKPGDRINKGDIIAEVETDKANMEIEAIDSGTLSDILVDEGHTAQVGDPIAVLNGRAKAKPEAERAKPEEQSKKAQEVKKEEIPESKTKKEEILEEPEKKKIEPAQFQYKTKEEAGEEKKESKELEKAKEGKADEEPQFIKSSPLARKLAREKNIDLSQVQGTGPGGRVTESDVRNLVQKPLREKQEEQYVEPEEKEGGQVKQLSRMRQTIARRMVNSKQNIPHFYVTYEVNVNRLIDFKNAAEEESQETFTYNDIFIKAVAIALKNQPMFNSTFKGDHIEINDRINIGIAYAVEEGLLVPVIHDCNKKSLREISKNTKEIKSKVKNNKLQPEDMSGGTFSISNMGMYGVDEFTAIINPPEAAGLAIGSIKQIPVVIDNNIEIANILKLTLSSDHRIVDGAEAANFLKSIKDILEDPEQIEV